MLGLTDFSVATNKNESYWHNASLQAIGVMLALLLVLPTIIRGGEGHWSGVDWAVLTAALLLVIASCAVLLVRVLRRTRDGRKPQ